MNRVSLFLGILTLLLGAYAHIVDVYSAEGLNELFQNSKQEELDVEINLLNDLNFSNFTLPLGASKNGTCIVYSGIFHGNGYSINDMRINNQNKQGYTHAGLFCDLKGATIENLVIESSCFFIGNWSGALSATASGSLTIKNVTNKAMTKGIDFVGGFIGHIHHSQQEKAMLIIDSCVNEGNVTENKTESLCGSGGLIGCVLSDMDIMFSKSRNTGSIFGSSAGGFSASIVSNMKMNVIDCINDGSVSGNFGFIGGFFGYVGNYHEEINIINSTNNGDVTGIGNCGGFIGSTQSSLRVSGNTNNGYCFVRVL